MSELFETMQYPHWLIVAGAALVALGFVGLAARRNQKPTEIKAIGKRDERDSKVASLPPWPWRPPTQTS
jgi:hypothetical protein